MNLSHVCDKLASEMAESKALEVEPFLKSLEKRSYGSVLKPGSVTLLIILETFVLNFQTLVDS